MSGSEGQAHPRLPGILAERVADQDARWPVSKVETAFENPYLGVSLDTIVDPAGQEHTRVVVRPHGAVAVLALDEDDRVLLVEQYRHPVGQRLIEIPAGTLDIEGEHPAEAAARELGEEADIHAAHWQPLLEMAATPGYSSERWTAYLATELTAVPETERTRREAEEADMRQWWVPFERAVDLVLDGRITDALTVGAILAAQVRRSR
ncbi:NUDIX hydrolase [Aeromicrobium sp. YIM 150415]|uniref:NUDIX domain-containing protein n=1 Tax=Aeromicrobium sp. YIM 150415 TaxID=2803912 RepID=UPI0019662EFD|nr:NUDIX hydrolase [Aeromicrobium sp. YIM 150415]MBM9465416.1 NUDIX hydrolase [Aeromicrobium sp. YIM 150415]